MSTQEKRIEKLKDFNKSITFDEVSSILIYFGFELNNKGKTSGSRVLYVRAKDNTKIIEKILYLIFDYPHKHYTFKHFEV